MNGTTFLTVAQAAKELNLTRQAVQLMIDEERIHALSILERWAIPVAEVKRVKKEKTNGKRKAA
jgi:excisionase family DNA binding protein